MKTFKQFFIETNNDLINNIKKFLMDDGGYQTWNEFVDNQSLGDCQYIINIISKKFPEVIHCFGEIKIDEPYFDEYNKKQNKMTHHWVLINNIIYDFSKGTLKDYIDWNDLYEVENSIEKFRYHLIRKY